jgi:hypothetical protein
MSIEVRRDSSRGHVGSDSRFCSSCGLWLRLRASSDVSCFLSPRIGSVSRRPWRGRNAGSRRDSLLRRQGARCSAFNIEHGPAVWNGCCGGRDAQRQLTDRCGRRSSMVAWVVVVKLKCEVSNHPSERCFFGICGQWVSLLGAATHVASCRRSFPAISFCPPLGEDALNKGAGQSWGRSQPFRGRPVPAECAALS